MSLAVDRVTAVMVGSEETRLVVLRGNSASGKSSVAAGLRERFGRGLALVAQDNLRRVVLREHDVPGAANIGLIDTVARYALDAGFHVVVEGILYADRYGDMLGRLCATTAARRTTTTWTYRSTKPSLADEVDETQLRDWYRPLHLLPDTAQGVHTNAVRTRFVRETDAPR